MQHSPPDPAGLERPSINLASIAAAMLSALRTFVPNSFDCASMEQ